MQGQSGSIQWHIGCSGFHYREWKGVFYPEGLPARRWFEYYCQHFNTLELNTTFYRFPTLSALQAWHLGAPENFSFSCKMPRSITHYKRFRETAGMVADFYALAREGLKEKLGCILTQLPPQFTYDEEKLFNLLEQLDPGFRNVIEFRHESWWRGDVMHILASRQISFCGVSFPRIRFDEAVINTPLAYYRFHGVPVLFYSTYDPTFISGVHQQLIADTKTKEAFVYFNNTASTAAIENAKALQGMIAGLQKEN